MEIDERIDAGIQYLEQHGNAATAVCLSADDFGQLVERLDAGDVHVSADGKYRGLEVCDLNEGASYIRTRTGRFFLHLVDHPVIGLRHA